MINIYFHLATMGNFQKIHDELLNLIESSGLLNACTQLKICVVGNSNVNKKIHDKIVYLNVGNIDDYEFPTLQLIENDSLTYKDNFKIFYLNGLGVTNDTIYKQSWRSYLSYFNIIKYNECISSLDDGYDVCGVDWRTDPVPHYSGNFWWANSNYILKLPKIETLNKPSSQIVLTLRHNAEMYIGMENFVKPRILHQSNVSQYERHMYTYDSVNYLEKVNNDNIIKIR